MPVTVTELRVPIVSDSDIITARQQGRALAAQIGFGGGDLTVIASDGIRRDFYEAVNLRESPQRIADHICARYSTHMDDALVLVARYLGHAS